MKRPNITPGPWTCEPAMERQDCGLRIHTQASAPYGMAHIYSPGANAEDNARAIAAVPDLLEALEDVATLGPEEVEPDVLLAYAQRARAALTKAGYTF